MTVNLIVHDVTRSVAFYREVLEAEVRHQDEDFAALRLGAHDLMLHAEHTYERHPWADELTRGGRRGLGAELRLLGPDADTVERRARVFGAPVLGPATDKSHGWRETWIADPDGYVWAVGHRIPA